MANSGGILGALGDVLKVPLATLGITDQKQKGLAGYLEGIGNAVGNVGSDVGSAILGVPRSSVTGDFGLSSGGSNPAGAPGGPGLGSWGSTAGQIYSSPQAQIDAFRQQYNIPASVTDDQIYSTLQGANKANVSGSSNLQTALNALAQNFGWQSNQSQSSLGSLLNPLQLQQFWTQTIAPYLAQSNQMLKTADSLPVNTQGLAPGYAQAIQNAEGLNSRAAANAQNFAVNAGAIQPMYTQELNQLSGLQAQALKAYQEQVLANQRATLTNPAISNPSGTGTVNLASIPGVS